VARRLFLAYRQRFGRRGAALTAFCILDVVYGIGLAWPLPPGIRSGSVNAWFNEILPLSVWAIVWWSVAVLCGWGAWSRSKRSDRYAFAAAIGIKVWWGTLCLIGWIMREVPVSSAGVWLGLAALVALIAGWPEPEPHVSREVSGE
jgi:hypothetical protein